MIVTVTLNPAIDVTYGVDDFTLGEVHRVRQVTRRPGGKGVNVASVLHALGVPVIAAGLSDPGFAAEVADLGIEADFVTSLPRVRSTVVVRSGEATTSLWEPGIPAPEGASDQVRERVAGLLAGASVLVVSGSLAPGLPANLPAALAQEARAAGVIPILDLDGDALVAAVEAGGSIVMPNEDELARLLGVSSVADGQAGSAAAALADRTGAAVVHTRGRAGLIGGTRGDLWRVRVPGVRGNPTGAGDATAAGLAKALLEGEEWGQALVAAAATGAAAVARPIAGEIDLDVRARSRDLASMDAVDPDATALDDGADFANGPTRGSAGSGDVSGESSTEISTDVSTEPAPADER